MEHLTATSRPAPLPRLHSGPGKRFQSVLTSEVFRAKAFNAGGPETLTYTSEVPRKVAPLIPNLTARARFTAFRAIGGRVLAARLAYQPLKRNGMDTPLSDVLNGDRSWL